MLDLPQPECATVDSENRGSSAPDVPWKREMGVFGARHALLVFNLGAAMHPAKLTVILHDV